MKITLTSENATLTLSEEWTRWLRGRAEARMFYFKSHPGYDAETRARREAIRAECEAIARWLDDQKRYYETEEPLE